MSRLKPRFRTIDGLKIRFADINAFLNGGSTR
jgi:hypothetical protein